MNVVAYLIIAEDGSKVISMQLPGGDPTHNIFKTMLDRPITKIEVFAEGELLEVIHALNRGYEKGKLAGAKCVAPLLILEALAKAANEDMTP